MSENQSIVTDEVNVPKSVQNVFVDIMLEHLNGISVVELNQFYKEKKGYSIDPLEWGHWSIGAVVNKLDHIFRTATCKAGNVWLFAAFLPVGEREKLLLSDPYDRIPRAIKINIRKLFTPELSAIPLDQLQSVYLKQHSSLINYELYGYASIKEFVDGHTGSLFRQSVKGDQIVLTVEKDLEIDPSLQISTNIDVLKKMDRNTFPPDCLAPHDSLYNLKKEDFVTGTCLEIGITAHWGNGYLNGFYFFLSKYKDSYEALDKELNHFYNERHEKYILPEWVPTEGLFCVAPYTDKRWYRVEILEDNLDNVRCVYVDLGYFWDVPKKDLRYLHMSFENWPCQIMLGKIAYCSPFSGPFTEEAEAFVKKTVEHKPLSAIVELYDGEKSLVMLSIVCGTFNLLDCLVWNNYAKRRVEIEELESKTDTFCDEDDVFSVIPLDAKMEKLTIEGPLNIKKEILNDEDDVFPVIPFDGRLDIRAIAEPLTIETETDEDNFFPVIPLDQKMEKLTIEEPLDIQTESLRDKETFSPVTPRDVKMEKLAIEKPLTIETEALSDEENFFSVIPLDPKMEKLTVEKPFNIQTESLRDKETFSRVTLRDVKMAKLASGEPLNIKTDIKDSIDKRPAPPLMDKIQSMIKSPPKLMKNLSSRQSGKSETHEKDGTSAEECSAPVIQKKRIRTNKTSLRTKTDKKQLNDQKEKMTAENRAKIEQGCKQHEPPHKPDTPDVKHSAEPVSTPTADVGNAGNPTQPSAFSYPMPYFHHQPGRWFPGMPMPYPYQAYSFFNPYVNFMPYYQPPCYFPPIMPQFSMQGFNSKPGGFFLNTSMPPPTKLNRPESPLKMNTDNEEPENSSLQVQVPLGDDETSSVVSSIESSSEEEDSSSGDDDDCIISDQEIELPKSELEEFLQGEVDVKTEKAVFSTNELVTLDKVMLNGRPFLIVEEICNKWPEMPKRVDFPLEVIGLYEEIGVTKKTNFQLWQDLKPICQSHCSYDDVFYLIPYKAFMKLLVLVSYIPEDVALELSDLMDEDMSLEDVFPDELKSGHIYKTFLDENGFSSKT